MKTQGTYDENAKKLKVLVQHRNETKRLFDDDHNMLTVKQLRCDPIDHPLKYYLAQKKVRI